MLLINDQIQLKLDLIPVRPQTPEGQTTTPLVRPQLSHSPVGQTTTHMVRPPARPLRPDGLTTQGPLMDHWVWADQWSWTLLRLTIIMLKITLSRYDLGAAWSVLANVLSSLFITWGDRQTVIIQFSLLLFLHFSSIVILFNYVRWLSKRTAWNSAILQR